jgi:hypothetical protein
MCFTYQFRVSLTSSGSVRCASHHGSSVPHTSGGPWFMGPGHRFPIAVCLCFVYRLFLLRLSSVSASFIVCFCFVYEFLASGTSYVFVRSLLVKGSWHLFMVP